MFKINGNIQPRAGHLLSPLIDDLETRGLDQYLNLPVRGKCGEMKTVLKTVSLLIEILHHEILHCFL